MKNIIERILEQTDIKVNGNRKWDLKVDESKITKEKLLMKFVSGGSLAFGESFMDEEWNVDDLEEMLFRIGRFADFENLLNYGDFWYFLKAKFFNLQSGKKAFEVGQKHYDIGNDLYEKMLGKTMSYTNGYWKNAENLDDAQIAKLDLICRKLNLQKGQKILDVGCGWGNFMKYATEKYGVECVGLSVSREQIKLGQELCKGLPVEFIFTDYNDFNPDYKFDHIVSIEMIEAVGPKNMKKFFVKMNSLLKDDGLFLLQVIGNTKTKDQVEPWINKYIFPNGNLPSLKQISNAIETKGVSPNLFLIEDLHDLGDDYSKTLKAWFENFDKSYRELSEKNPKYDTRFYKMWKYYLLSCAAMERARNILSWQIVFSKKGLLGGYNSVR